MSALNEGVPVVATAEKPVQSNVTEPVTVTSDPAEVPKPRSKNRRLSVAIRSIAAESGVASLVGLAEKPIEQRGLSMSQEIKVIFNYYHYLFILIVCLRRFAVKLLFFCDAVEIGSAREAVSDDCRFTSGVGRKRTASRGSR